MWTITKANLLFTIVSLSIAADTQNGDEERPYEFGFTIDGQQHRHEKKDEKGIIQGEFGFITADGIYHTTVYATDENGKFKILSMKSLRISAPLDGSSFKGTISPDANKYRKQAGLALLPDPSPSPNALLLPEETPQPIDTTTVKTKEIYKFVTQSTVKPACAGCGYITTKKPQPGEKFQFQSAFVKVPPQELVQTQGQKQPTIKPNEESFDAPQNVQNSLPQPPNQLVQTSQFDQERYNQQQQFNQQEQQQFHQQQANKAQPGQLQSQPVHFEPAQNNHSDTQGAHQHQEPQPNALGFPNPEDIRHQVQQEAQNSVASNGRQGSPVQPQSSLPPIEVKDNVINVGGANPLQIPIKDKFPGMEEGLPEGVSEKDITDLLYKFSYTVGFHGHYEKGLKNGAKIGGYFVNGRDGFSRVVTYVADENGYRPKFKLINLGLDSDETPKPETEKTFGLKNFEFVWYPIE